MFVISLRLLVVGVLGVSAVACENTTTPDYEIFDGAISSIRYLKSQCTTTEVRLSSSLIIRGVVVANDAFGERNRCLTLQDSTGGISVHLDHNRTGDYWPFGTRVKLFCNGLTLRNYGGRIEIGYDPDNSGFRPIPAERISLHLQRDVDLPSLPEPRVITIDALEPSDADTYVRVQGVRFHESGCWCDLDPADESGTSYLTTVRTVTDAAGRELSVRTSGQCHYAREKLPTGEVDLCGVVEYFNGTYALCVVNHSVIQHRSECSLCSAAR